MGGFEAGSLDSVEPTLKYHPGLFEILTLAPESGLGTVHGRQFDWGGLLPKCNGGVRRYPSPDIPHPEGYKNLFEVNSRALAGLWADMKDFAQSVV